MRRAVDGRRRETTDEEGWMRRRRKGRRGKGGNVRCGRRLRALAKKQRG